MQETDTIDRRTFVWRTGAVTGTLAVAGCLGDDEGDGNEDGEDGEDGNGGDEDGDDADLPAFPEIEETPDAVYVPTHREAMRTLEPIEAGEYTLAPMLSYPHPFWIVAGEGGDDEVEAVAPEDGRGVHMMFALWDAETGIVLPVDAGVQIRVSKGGERVGSPRSPWAMISQEMGFHFGDNVPLDGDGTYEVEVALPSLSTRLTGDLEGRFAESATATFEFEYDDEFREAVVGGVDYLDEELWGERGALEPMDHGGHGHDGEDDGDSEENEDRGDGAHVPYSALPEASTYPGTLLTDPDDLPRSGDAAFVATLLESGSRLAAGDDRYLLVSPRTPYNRVPLADMALRATIERDGEAVREDELEQTIDGEFDLHYGLSLADVAAGDTVRIEIESPPQVARHRGYETAFLEMEPVELQVSDE